MAETAIDINGEAISYGERRIVDLPVTRLYTHTSMAMPVHVLTGRRPGKRLFVSAAVHGDELNGVEIIRRLLKQPALKRLRGVLIAVPVVNIHGFIQRSRYLPDRRDLNRNFPGSESGSLTARLAYRFMTEIVERCDYGIDLHTGAIHRGNLPQIRGDLNDTTLAALAEDFDAPVILHAPFRDGSLRQAAGEQGIPTLLYEAGEALRIDEMAIRIGIRGVLNVLRGLGMLPRTRGQRPSSKAATSVRCGSSHWVRTPESGMLQTPIALGQQVTRGQPIAILADPFGERERTVTAPISGVVLGRTTQPLVNEGDAIFHLGQLQSPNQKLPALGELEELYGIPILDTGPTESPLSDWPPE